MHSTRLYNRHWLTPYLHRPPPVGAGLHFVSEVYLWFGSTAQYSTVQYSTVHSTLCHQLELSIVYLKSICDCWQPGRSQVIYHQLPQLRQRTHAQATLRPRHWADRKAFRPPDTGQTHKSQLMFLSILPCTCWNMSYNYYRHPELKNQNFNSLCHRTGRHHQSVEDRPC